MATLAYPYPNLFPYIESKCLWSYSVDGEEHKEFKEPLSNWDYNASLEIKCKLTWDIRDIFEQANLLTIINYSRIAIIEISSPGQICSGRKKIFDYPLIDLKKLPDQIILKINSLNNSSNIQFRLIIYTENCELNRFKYKKGSILYDEISTLVLEGERARISLQRWDFKEFNNENAMWFVRFDPKNLYQTFNETYTLYLNINKKNLEDQIRRSIHLKDALKTDFVITIMCSTLLNEDLDIDLDEDYPDSSLGFQIKEWLKYFGIESKTGLEKFKFEITYNQNIVKRKCQNLFCSDFD